LATSFAPGGIPPDQLDPVSQLVLVPPSQLLTESVAKEVDPANKIMAQLTLCHFNVCFIIKSLFQVLSVSWSFQSGLTNNETYQKGAFGVL
jgi:hypothetical protein